jgi:uncharacterized cupin superfamily protein
MSGLTRKSFDDADEVRTPPMGRIEVVNLGEATVARFTLEPGWHWDEHVKPIAGTDTCQAHHIGAVVSGRMRVTHADGGDLEIGPGDTYELQPGHDARIISDEPFVGYEFDSTTAQTFARE